MILNIGNNSESCEITESSQKSSQQVENVSLFKSPSEKDKEHIQTNPQACESRSRSPTEKEHSPTPPKASEKLISTASSHNKAINKESNGRMCQIGLNSLFEFEEDSEDDITEEPLTKTNMASRSLITIRRTRLEQAESSAAFKYQDNFVIESCDLSVSLNPNSGSAKQFIDDLCPTRKMNAMHKKLTQLLPFQVSSRNNLITMQAGLCFTWWSEIKYKLIS